MYGKIVTFYEFAVHFCVFNISARGRGKHLPYGVDGDCTLIRTFPIWRHCGRLIAAPSVQTVSSYSVGADAFIGPKDGT